MPSRIDETLFSLEELGLQTEKDGGCSLLVYGGLYGVREMIDVLKIETTCRKSRLMYFVVLFWCTMSTPMRLNQP